jgi:hypothetical protein
MAKAKKDDGQAVLAETGPLPPLCVAGCAWFTPAGGELGARGHGLCRRHPQRVGKQPGDFCGEFETTDDYRRRRARELAAT